MNFLGVGGTELLLILLIALIVAGPRRLITWSYELGRWLARAQRIWAESARMMQRELDEADIDFKVPRQIPTRRGLNQQLKSAIRRAAAPIQEPLDELQGEIRSDLNADIRTLDQASRELRGEAKKTQPPATGSPDYGSWSEKES